MGRSRTRSRAGEEAAEPACTPGRSGRGELLFSLVLELPGQWSDEERRLLEQLRVLRSEDPRRSWLKSASL